MKKLWAQIPKKKVMSAVLEASREGTKKLSVLRVEQCEDKWPTEKWDHEYILWHKKYGWLEIRVETVKQFKYLKIGKFKKIWKLHSIFFKKKLIVSTWKEYRTFSPGWCYQPGLKDPLASAHDSGHVEEL
jgi:hypothetical protein